MIKDIIQAGCLKEGILPNDKTKKHANMLTLVEQKLLYLATLVLMYWKC